MALGAPARSGFRGRHPASGAVGVLLILVLLTGFARPAVAEEPLLAIMKNTLLGGATGLILGGTLTLVADEDSRSDIVRWGVVIGTFGGFALGAALAWRGEEDLFPDTYDDSDSAGGVPLRLSPPRPALLASRATRLLQERALHAREPAATGAPSFRLALVRIIG